ncbi:MAG TPA: hypothetical protein VFA41_20940 [Ktedonobacteraceae bacterium]|jgi:hypothetical protein|nr:hypothetical protein [Ktedonobacteraceae bacterium]
MNYRRSCLYKLIKLIFIGLIALAVVDLGINLAFMIYNVKHHPQLDDVIPAFSIKVAPTNARNYANIFVTLPNEKGSSHPILFPCREWAINANIITPSPTVQPIIGASVYSLIQVVGQDCLDKHGHKAPYPPISLINKDNDLFMNVQHCQLLYCLLTAQTITSQYLKADGHTYDVYITSGGILLIPAHS